MNKQKNTHKLHIVIEADNTIVRRNVHLVPHSDGWEIFPSLGMAKTFFNTRWEALVHLHHISSNPKAVEGSIIDALESWCKCTLGKTFEEYVEHG